MERDLLSRLGKLAVRVAYGPRVSGGVEAIRRDRNRPRFWHVLVRTDEGDLRHFVEPDRSLVISSRGLEILDSPWKRGDRFVTNIRGTGFARMPWSRLETDPFELKKQTK